jgi:hypothetical protein
MKFRFLQETTMNSKAAFLCALLAISPGLALGQKTCCLCKAAPQYGSQDTVRPGFGENCAAICRGFNEQAHPFHTKWHVNRDSSCDLPPQLTPENIRNKVEYNIGHQGAGVWTNNSDELIKGEELRKSLMNADFDTWLIEHAPIEILEQEAPNAVERCVAAEPLAQVGRLDDEDVVRLNRAVVVFLGLAGSN